MNILISGCSFTAPNHGWASNFSKKDPKFNVSNIAHSGAGNTYIRRQIQTEIFQKNRIGGNKKYDFAIIQWSTIDRWDYPISFTSENDTPIIKLNLDDDWVGKVGYSRNGTSLEGKSSIFYENLYSKYGQLLNTLDDIYYTQLFLENLGIPYLMFTKTKNKRVRN